MGEPESITMPREEVKVTTETDGDQSIKTTVTTIYHEDGRVQTKTSTETTTRRRVENTERHRVSARTQNRTTNKDGRRVKKTTVTTTFSDGTTEDEVSETDLGPAEFETTTETRTSRRSSSSASHSSEVDSPVHRDSAYKIEVVMNEDIDRLNAE